MHGLDQVFWIGWFCYETESTQRGCPFNTGWGIECGYHDDRNVCLNLSNATQYFKSVDGAHAYIRDKQVDASLLRNFDSVLAAFSCTDIMTLYGKQYFKYSKDRGVVID